MVSMTENEETPEITMDDVVYFMGWHIDSQRRIYDCMLALIATLGENEKAKELQAMHERGQFLYPPPWAQGQQQEKDDKTKRMKVPSDLDDTDEIEIPSDIADVDPADTHEWKDRI